MRISMIRPMPFCPSFEPCAKLTPVQVSSSRPRIQNGGGRVPTGASKRCLLFTTARSVRSSSAATTQPIMGESSSDLPMFEACFQSTPLVAVFTAMNWFASPTPMTDPISVCELDDGSPKYQVPRFQMIAAVSSANTIAKPAPLPTCRINSTGSSEMIPNATAPVDVTTPRKFQTPDQTTAACGVSECV